MYETYTGGCVSISMFQLNYVWVDICI